MRFHSSCLFHTGQSLLVDFDLCAFTLLVFFTLVNRCWPTLACAFPLVLSFLTLVNRCWWTLACALPTVLSFLTLVRRCWRTLTCALPLVLSFLTLVTPFCRLSRVIQPTTSWGYTFFRTVAAKKLVGLGKQHCLDAVYLGLYNRHQVGVRPFYRQSRLYNRQQVGVRVRVRVGVRLFS